MARDTSLIEMEEKEKKRGKRDHQKLKPYVVYQLLMHGTDQNHVLSAREIVEALDLLGISAERRGIYKDIEGINQVVWMMENDSDIEEAIEVIAEDEDDCEKLIVYDKNRKGFYAKNRRYDLDTIRLLAECIHSSRFMTKPQVEQLLNVVYSLVSDAEVEKIKHTALLTDPHRIDNKAMLINISNISKAMSKEIEGQPHVPSKITFEYLFHTVGSLDKPQARKRRQRVSPYHLLINDGNYYLLAFNEKTQRMWTYRVDRMRDVQELGEPREGENEFLKIDLFTYPQRVFSMFRGKEEYVQMRFTNDLLDTVLDRFGTKGTEYKTEGTDHFIIKTPIEISKPFYAWVFGFGNKVKLLGPPSVVEGFKDYLKTVSEMY